jgi:hypothetical protein
MTSSYDMSPAMKASLRAKKGAVMKYNWLGLEPGKSFQIAVDEIKLSSLKTLAFRTGKRYGIKFKVLHHTDLKVYEVARIDGLPRY